RREARLQRGHPVEGRERFSIASELHERIPDYAVAPRRERRDDHGASPEPQRLAEAVPREGKRTEATCREQVIRGETQRATKDAFGFCVIARVAGFTGPLLVGEPQETEPVHVDGIHTK